MFKSPVRIRSETEFARLLIGMVAVVSLSACSTQIKTLARVAQTTLDGVSSSVDLTAPLPPTGTYWAQSETSLYAHVDFQWDPAGSADAVEQTIQLYSDGTCTTPSGSPIPVGDGTSGYLPVTLPGSGEYSYTVTTSDAAGNASVGACSSSLEVSLATFSDDFSDNVISAADWENCSPGWNDLLEYCTAASRSDITISETGGKAVLSFTTGNASADYLHNGYTTKSAYDFTDSILEVELVDPPDDGDGHFGAGLEIDFGAGTGNGIMLYKFGNELTMEVATSSSYSSVPAIPWDAIPMRFLRIRHSLSEGKIHFETSSNGDYWFDQGELAADPAWNLKEATFSLVGEVDPTGESALHSAKFDHFATNAPKISGFANPAAWQLESEPGSYIGGDATMSISLAGGVLSVGEAANDWSGNGLESKGDYDLQAESFQAELIQPPVQDGLRYRESGIWFTNAAGDGFEVFVANGLLQMGSWSDSAGTGNQTNIPFDPVAHRWMRIRHDDGADTIVFETSPDGATWTAQRTMARGGIPISVVHLIVYGYTSNNGHGPTGSPTAQWMNFSTTAIRNPP